MKSLSRAGLLAVFVLTITVVSMAVSQENKNRRGDGTSAPPIAKKEDPSKTEVQPGDAQANSPADSNKKENQRARQERHKRLP